VAVAFEEVEGLDGVQVLRREAAGEDDDAPAEVEPASDGCANAVAVAVAVDDTDEFVAEVGVAVDACSSVATPSGVGASVTVVSSILGTGDTWLCRWVVGRLAAALCSWFATELAAAACCSVCTLAGGG